MARNAKRLLALLLALMMCVSLLPATALAEEEDAGTIELAETPETPEEGTIAPAADPEALPPAEEAEEVLASGDCGDDLTWTLTDDGVLTISGTGDMWDFEYNYEDGGNAPWAGYITQVRRLVVSEGVTSLGREALIPAKT